MADLTVTYSDTDQSNLLTQIGYIYTAAQNMDANHDSVAWQAVHRNLTYLANMMEDKHGVARGTYHGSGAGGPYITPQSGGIGAKGA